MYVGFLDALKNLVMGHFKGIAGWTARGSKAPRAKTDLYERETVGSFLEEDRKIEGLPLLSGRNSGLR